MENKTTNLNSSVYFTVTVDAEADNAWTSPDKIELNNFEEIPRFQELCEKYNIIPTYLLTYEYATYKPAIDFFRRKLEEGKCEIGYHLHVWSTPPFSKEKNGVDMDWLHAYQYELPDDLFEAKAKCLYEAIYNSFKIYPKSHRAGRWGVDDRTINWLVRNSFTVDSSVVPHVNFETSLGKNSKGPNFANRPQKLHFWKTNEGNSILEVPVTVYKKKYQVLDKLLDINQVSSFVTTNKYTNRFISKIYKPKMLRPNPLFPPSFYKDIITNFSRNNETVFNMMLHSSELSLNCSPISKSKSSCDKIWASLEKVFNYVDLLKIHSVSLSKLGSISFDENREFKLSVGNYNCRQTCS